ncbi:hypothetical protein ACFV1L_24500 [Kitasatospora sp. NPDC059646]|uniref:hypothetical protein n=1 Tax=Kitasatospora sp. NPDC059646 TaxID=3346893 RepID=UPI0036CF3116
MSRVRIDRSNPDVVDVVLREGAGPLGFAVRRWAEGAFGSLVIGVVCGIPVYLGLASYGAGAGRIWAAVGAAALLGLVVTAVADARGAYRDARRLRFSPAAAPDTLTVLRATRTDPPRPLTDVRQIWLEHSLVESYRDDGKPPSARLTLFVLLADGRLLRPTTLPPFSTDTEALHRELEQLLAPAGVQVDLVVKRTRRSYLS